MGERTLAKAQRLGRVSHLLHRNPQGLTVAELARMCGVHKRTIQRDLHDLEATGVPIWADGNDPPRYGITEGYYLPPIHLSLDDAVALYLAGRLLARQADAYTPEILHALAKLAGILPESIATHVHETVREMASHPQVRTLGPILSTLALGWAAGRAVTIRYQAIGSEHVHGYRLHPYFIDACGEYRGFYVIGWADYFDAVHTFRVERILEARLTNETYEIPRDFAGPALLRSAWGVMYGPELQTVCLRFGPEAARRVQETCWHPSQRLTEGDDGGCLLEVSVAHPEEMLFWIRSWGAQVEVLAPGWLREQLGSEAQEIARVYGNDRSALN